MLSFTKYIMLNQSSILFEAAIAASGQRAQRHTNQYIKPFLSGEPNHQPLSHEMASNIGHLKSGDKVTLHSHHVDENGIHHVVVSKKGSSKKIAIPTSKIKKPSLGRAGKSTYNDEHALKTVWNHFVSAPKKLTNKKTMLDEISKARNDKSHPLHFDNQTDDGFSGKKKTEAHRESYYEELERATHAVHGLATHPEFKQAVSSKSKMTVSGAARGKLSDIWTKNGAKNTTSKADVIIGEGKNKRTLSLKKGRNSQLMSAEPSEMMATYDHATDEHVKANSGFTAEHKKEVLKQISQVHKHLSSMSGADRPTQEKLRDKAQSIINGIHKKHPNLIRHIADEASQGHGKFGRDGVGTARFIVSTTGSGSHVHDTVTGEHPIQSSPVPRVALPKGQDNRPGNLKLDYTTK